MFPCYSLAPQPESSSRPNKVLVYAYARTQVPKRQGEMMLCRQLVDHTLARWLLCSRLIGQTLRRNVSRKVKEVDASTTHRSSPRYAVAMGALQMPLLFRSFASQSQAQSRLRDVTNPPPAQPPSGGAVAALIAAQKRTAEVVARLSTQPVPDGSGSTPAASTAASPLSSGGDTLAAIKSATSAAHMLEVLSHHAATLTVEQLAAALTKLPHLQRIEARRARSAHATAAAPAAKQLLAQLLSTVQRTANVAAAPEVAECLYGATRLLVGPGREVLIALANLFDGTSASGEARLQFCGPSARVRLLMAFAHMKFRYERVQTGCLPCQSVRGCSRNGVDP